MPEPLNVALIGVGGGIGAVHLSSMKRLEDEGLVELVAVAETNQEGNRDILNSLRSMDILVYNDWEDMIDRTQPDAVTISAPHHFHVPMSTYSLRKGVHVFCEKPPAVTVASGKRFVESMRDNKKIVGVNYMYTAAESAMQLRDNILQGELGRIEKIIAKGLWARSNEYYSRKPWAGKRRFNGQPVRDGCLFNQFPHLLNQCIYFVSNEGVPNVANVRAELYRGHSKKYTEMEDTVSLYARVNNVDVLLYCTVCHPKDEDLSLEVIGTKGTAKWSYKWYSIEHMNAQGTAEKSFPAETRESMCLRMYRNFIEKVREETPSLYWNLEQALVVTSIVCQAYESGIRHIHRKYAPEKPLEQGETAGSIRTGGEEIVPVIEGISGIITEAAKQGRMFSEMNVPWAKPKGYEGVN